jgi:hypothetical protein
MVIKSRNLGWDGHVSRTGKMRNTYKILVTDPEGNRPLGRLGGRCKDNMKMVLE